MLGSSQLVALIVLKRLGTTNPCERNCTDKSVASPLLDVCKAPELKCIRDRSTFRRSLHLPQDEFLFCQSPTLILYHQLAQYTFRVLELSFFLMPLVYCSSRTVCGTAINNIELTLLSNLAHFTCLSSYDGDASIGGNFKWSLYHSPASFVRILHHLAEDDDMSASNGSVMASHRTWRCRPLRKRW